MNTNSPAPAAETPTPAPTSEPTSTPVAPTAQPVTPASSDPDATPTAEPKSFALPEAYKDKPWASKIKTEEDLYKQIDNQETLIGKKSIVPDLAKSTPEERESYYAQLRPESKDAYDAFDAEFTDPTIKDLVGDLLHKNGVSAVQGNEIIKGFQEVEKARLIEATSAEGFTEEMKKSFGDKFDGNVSAVVKEHKQHLSKDDQAMMEALPNQALGLVYRLTAAMAKAYGASESSIAADPKGGAAPPTGDIEAIRSDLRTKINELSNRVHTADEKQKLVDQLTATYKGK